jgi:hypothetical protein
MAHTSADTLKDNGFPLVSVLMPVYNREKFVDEAIESVLAQDYNSFELVLVDDGSTDASPQILKRWQEKDSRIVVVTAPHNEGIPGALNRGLAHARGKYIARIDSDDVMLPGRLSAQVQCISTRPDVILITSPFEYMDVNGKYVNTWKSDTPHEVVVFLLNFFNIIAGHGQVMYRKEDVLAEGGYSMDYPSSEDFDLWVKLLKRGRIECVPVPAMRQRIHPNQSPQQYAAVKRKNWHGIMGNSLRHYLGREVSFDEIEALITLWRRDGKAGMAPLANAVTQETFKRFCELNSKPFQFIASRRIAEEWQHTGDKFMKQGNETEAREYYRIAKEWHALGHSSGSLMTLFKRLYKKVIH